MTAPGEYMEYRGEKAYSKRNYNPKYYTEDIMTEVSIGQMRWDDFMKNIYQTKVACLHKAERDIETTMFAVEKDEDYFPEFKECVKFRMTNFL